MDFQLFTNNITYGSSTHQIMLKKYPHNFATWKSDYCFSFKSFIKLLCGRESCHLDLVINNFEKETAHGNITAEMVTFESLSILIFFFFANCWKQIQPGIWAVSSCNITQRWRYMESSWRCVSPSIYINLSNE